MRVLVSILFIFFFIAQAFAAEPAPAPSGKSGAPGTNVEMPFLMAPMTGSDGKLSGYAYISTRLTATSSAGALDVRDKIAFIQDAFVRDVNATAVTKPGDPTSVDSAAVETRLLADARRVMGPGKVSSITIVQLQIAPLHPNKTETPATQPPPDAPALGGEAAKAAPATQAAAK